MPRLRNANGNEQDFAKDAAEFLLADRPDVWTDLGPTADELRLQEQLNAKVDVDDDAPPAVIPDSAIHEVDSVPGDHAAPDDSADHGQEN